MIARIWHGRTDADRFDEYMDYMTRTGVRDLRATPGNQRVLVLCERGEKSADIVFISLWDSLESIRAFAGDDITKARYYPRDTEFLHELEPNVRHLDVAADAT